MTATPLRRKRPSEAEIAQEAGRQRAMDWLESQARVMGVWLDRLVADAGDPRLAGALHAQHAWLESTLDRLRRG